MLPVADRLLPASGAGAAPELRAPEMEPPQLDAALLVAVWEAATGEAMLRRAAMLLAAAWPERDWMRTPIGTRDRCLFRLRERLFGAAMDASVDCPACGATLDLPLTTRDLLVADASMPSSDVERDGYAVRFRLPETVDLLHVADAPADDRAKLLLDRCVVAAACAGAPCAAAALPEPVRAAVAAAMAAADPQADPRLGLTCPECGHGWSAPFDIAAFLWDDVEDFAARLLRQVHVLAAAYGWSEAAILGLTARRRRWYVEAVTGLP